MKSDKTGMGIVSIVLGVIGFFIFGLILGILSIIFGGVSYETTPGKVGFFIGLFDVVAVLFFIFAGA